MTIKKQLRNNFTQLCEALHQLSETQYAQTCHSLFNATIGQHIRHIIEFFLCLEKGYKTGRVNYERRQRDYKIENDKNFAIALLEDIYDNIEKTDKALTLETEVNEDSESGDFISTSYHREILYNLEHSIHHMALIRIGINEVSDIKLSEEFGVANATSKFRKQRA